MRSSYHRRGTISQNGSMCCKTRGLHLHWIFSVIEMELEEITGVEDMDCIRVPWLASEEGLCSTEFWILTSLLTNRSDLSRPDTGHRAGGTIQPCLCLWNASHLYKLVFAEKCKWLELSTSQLPFGGCAVATCVRIWNFQTACLSTPYFSITVFLCDEKLFSNAYDDDDDDGER
jgi:hypothetical protein